MICGQMLTKNSNIPTPGTEILSTSNGCYAFPSPALCLPPTGLTLIGSLSTTKSEDRGKLVGVNCPGGELSDIRYMASDTRDKPFLGQFYQAFICQNVVPVGLIKVDSARLSYPLLNNQMYRYPSFFKFPMVS